MKRELLVGVSLIGAVYSLSACVTPITYSAEPMEAWIVDADTGKPIEGAVVVADWVLEGGIHVDRVGDLKILETTTDKAGRFLFPSWGPIRHWGLSRLTYMDPELTIFKSGYEYRRLANPTTKEAIEGKPYPVRRSQWSGKTIELKRFVGTVKEYASRFHDLNSGLEQIVSKNPEDCNWKKLPIAIIATESERKNILALALQQNELNPHTVGSIYQEIVRNDDWYTKKGRYGCGSPKEFFTRVVR